MAVVAYRSSFEVLALVLACCAVGYVYQGPPFRRGPHRSLLLGGPRSPCFYDSAWGWRSDKERMTVKGMMGRD